MSALRRLGPAGLRRARQAAAPQQAGYSSVSDFVKSVKSAVEGSPELKQSVEQLKKGAESLSERTKAAAEDLKRSAGQASEQVRASASQFTEAAGTAFRSGEAPASGAAGDASKASTSGAGEAETEAASSSTSGSEGAAGHRATQAAPSLGARLRSAFQAVRKEVEDAVLPRAEQTSATRARDPSIRPAGGSDASGLAVVRQPESAWQKQWAEMQEKLGLHPIWSRLRGLSDNRVFNRGREVAGDLRERWETSDSPLVQRMQDVRDSMFAESEQGQVLRAIRAKSPDFDMARFLRVLKGDVPVVIKAYLEGDLPALRQHCSPEMVERFSGIIAAQKAEGLVTDSTILDVADVELVDLKFVEGDPVVVVQFSCQQINCARDAFGNVVEGGPQDVQRVYYFWALRQADAGFVGEDGQFHPPRWQLREMMLRGMHNLL